jgi:hypothetical protein
MKLLIVTSVSEFFGQFPSVGAAASRDYVAVASNCVSFEDDRNGSFVAVDRPTSLSRLAAALNARNPGLFSSRLTAALNARSSG